jgi:hypothetical protein
MSRLEMLEWINGIGAATAEALAEHDDVSTRSARARMGAAHRDGMLAAHRPLAGQPALYTLTPRGARSLGAAALAPCRVSNANTEHLIVCARVAASLEHGYPDHLVIGERELRRRERDAGAPLASARLAGRGGGDIEVVLHRPDLVLWPAGGGRALPVAVEVELAVKAPQRLAAICRAWARCREVAGVLYLAAPAAERALSRAIASADASAQVVVVPLGALPTRDLR